MIANTIIEKQINDPDVDITIEEMGEIWANEIAKEADTFEWIEDESSESTVVRNTIDEESNQCQDTTYELYAQNVNENKDTIKGYLKITSERPLKAYLLGPDGKTALADAIDIPYINEFVQVLKRPIMEASGMSETDVMDSISDIFKQVKADLGINDFYKMWKGTYLPYSYDVINGDLIKTTTKRNRQTKEMEIDDVVFTPTPITTSRIGRDVDNNDYWIEVTLMDIRGNEVKEFLRQDELFGKGGIKKLIRKGLVFTESDYKDMNKYLLDIYSLNANSLQTLIIASSYGWKENNSYFVLGDRAISSRGVQEAKVVGMEDIAAYEKKGTLEGWVKGVKDILNQDLTRLKFYAAATAVILEIVVQNSFILHNMGPSGGAKSTTAMTAMSMFGKPRLKDAKSTQKGSALLNQRNPNLPLIYDEIGDDPKEANDFKEQVYDLVNGNERATSDSDQKLRVSKRFKTVIQSVGEIELVDDGDYEGMHVRVVTIRETLEHLPSIKELEKTIATNYGHVGDPYIQKVLKYKNELPEWYDRQHDKFPHYDTTQASRVKGYFAAMAVAGEILEEVFSDIGLPQKEPYAICQKYYEQVANDNPIEKFHIQILSKAYSWFMSNISYFQHEELTKAGNTKSYILNGNSSPPSFKYGWYSDKYIDFNPDELAHHIKMRDNKKISSAYKEWKKEGIICTEGVKRHQARPYKIVNNTKKKIPVIRVCRDKLEYVLGLDGSILDDSCEDIK